MAGSEKEQPRPVEQENEPGPLTSSLRKSSMSAKKKGVSASQTGKRREKKVESRLTDATVLTT